MKDNKFWAEFVEELRGDWSVGIPSQDAENVVIAMFEDYTDEADRFAILQCFRRVCESEYLEAEADKELEKEYLKQKVISDAEDNEQC